MGSCVKPPLDWICDDVPLGVYCTTVPGFGACPNITQPPRNPTKLAVAITMRKLVFDFFEAISFSNYNFNAPAGPYYYFRSI